VLAQSPQSGKAAEGSTVTLTIAQAPPNVTVPQLRGLTQDAASALLGKLGLVPSPVTETRSVNPQYNNVVLSQFPLHGTSVAPGTTVVIRVESYVPPVGPTGPTGPSGAGGPAGASGSSG
jgi:serine/threonine-protein kinase